jgi:hypothetical protein
MNLYCSCGTDVDSLLGLSRQMSVCAHHVNLLIGTTQKNIQLTEIFLNVIYLWFFSLKQRTSEQSSCWPTPVSTFLNAPINSRYNCLAFLQHCPKSLEPLSYFDHSIEIRCAWLMNIEITIRVVRFVSAEKSWQSSSNIIYHIILYFKLI